MENNRNWRYWRNLIVFTLLILCFGMLGALIRVSYQGAQNYMHPVRVQRSFIDTPAQFGIAYQSINLTTNEGVELEAWYTQSQNGAIILVAHGYAAARSAEMHTLFARHGYGVISWDARAHGESGGELCTWGIYEKRDVVAAIDFARSQTNVEHVGAYGQSMGGVTLIEASVECTQIEAVVADSPFAAIEDMLERLVLFPPLRPGIRFFVEQETGLGIDDLRSVDMIGQIAPRPVFLIQGLDDATVPPDSAQRLYAVAGEPRKLWTEPGVGHVGMREAFPEEYEQVVVSFFDQYLLDQ
ncbi:MAG: alpha/beta fold hydrolase [Chloroflexota bacterium]|nr:alpha/beta fold hydrolase [Chloroflexota bacterium]